MTKPVIAVLTIFLEDVTADRYGLELMSHTGLASGSLYPILSRLRRIGWVEAHWESIDPVAAGRPARRYYRMTQEGVVAARQTLAKRAAAPSSTRANAKPGVNPAW